MDWTKPISVGNLPEGAEVISLPVSDPPLAFIGRWDDAAIIETPMPCGDVTGVRRMRCPTTGLHVPGEQAPVALVNWCPEHSRVQDVGFDVASESERQWGWAHTTVS